MMNNCFPSVVENRSETSIRLFKGDQKHDFTFPVSDYHLFSGAFPTRWTCPWISDKSIGYHRLQHTSRCHAIALWMVIILSAGKMHCCIYVTMLIIFLMEGPLRLVIATPILKITRRKGLYLFICASAFCFLGKNSVGYIDVGDGCWRPNVLVTF